MIFNIRRYSELFFIFIFTYFKIVKTHHLMVSNIDV